MRQAYILRSEGTIVLRKGAWVADTDYAAGNLVTDSGLWYYCYVPHLSASANRPGTGADWEDCWEPWGQGGGSANITGIAGTGGVNAFQVALMGATGFVTPADGDNATHAGLVVGMAIANIVEGASGSIQQSGEIENLAWTLEPGAIYFLGTAGTLSQTPSSGFWQRIGIAKSSTVLIINLSEPIRVV